MFTDIAMHAVLCVVFGLLVLACSFLITFIIFYLAVYTKGFLSTMGIGVIVYFLGCGFLQLIRQE